MAKNVFVRHKISIFAKNIHQVNSQGYDNDIY